MSMPSFRPALAALALVLAAGLAAPPARASATPLQISNVPLTLAKMNHPQVLIALGNSQSMDGAISGAIMTGSGALPSGDASLSASSSPTDYAVPPGFTPPLAAGTNGQAPYTVQSGGLLYDNGASRLNVAKQGIKAIIQAYLPSTDFALMDYQVSSVSSYATWVYEMSPPGAGFSFYQGATPPAGVRTIANPCYDYTAASSNVNYACKQIGQNLYGTTTLNDSPWMGIGASSDDASIVDVLYAPSDVLPAVDVNESGPHPASPYPPNFSLSDYNHNNVVLTYNTTVPDIGQFGTSPTNAGYVPYSPQVMYIARGFGFYGSNVGPGTGHVVVPMTTAGTTPTASSLTAAYDKFLPPLAPESNSTDTPDIKASAIQSPLAGLLQGARNQLALTDSSSSGCPPQQNVILITDGLPTLDLNGNDWPPLGSAAAAGYGVTATFNSNGSLATTNDAALSDTIAQLAALRAAGIKTYVIGLGAGVDPALNPQAAATLTAMAIAGGTGVDFPATSPSSLVTDLNSILVQVQQGTMATTSAAVNSTGLNAGSVVYQASYTVADTPYQDWTGNILAYPIDPATGQVNMASTAIKWSAQQQLDQQAAGTGWQTRILATWNPASGRGVPLLWPDLSATQQADLEPSDTLGPARLDYLSGDTSLEVRNGGTFRNRSHILGDIIDSDPIDVGPPAGPYGDASYLAFENAEAARPTMLYVGSNDGFVHAIDPSTGREMFAFAPNTDFANWINLTMPLYNSRHQFFVDGSPQASDVQFNDGTWHTILFGGENAGGNSIYALDITNPSSITSESALAGDVLWEYTDASMGLSYSTPAAARINAPAGFAVFFGNGYNSPQQEPVLKAVNAQTGALLASINLCAADPGTCNPNLPNGLGPVVVVNKNGLLGYPVDTVYAGDLQGNLWAVDVDATQPSQWTARLLFKATDPNGNPQPITTAPVVSLSPDFNTQPGVVVMFGTGQMLQQADLANTQTQTFYGILDTGAAAAVAKSSLVQQTLTDIPSMVSGLPEDVRVSSDNPVDWSTQDGWYVNLPATGERLVSDPRLDNGGVVFTSYAPSSNTCNTGGTSWLMDLNYTNGGPFAQPELDVNGDGQLNTQDQVAVTGSNGTTTLANPVGMSLGASYAAAPTIISANLGAVHAVKLVTKSTGQIESVRERGGAAGRTGWWQQ